MRCPALAARLSVLPLLPLLACSAPLPESESRGAQLYAQRCSGCHRPHAPGTMTAAMWTFQVERMQGEMVRRGMPPLRPDERVAILKYLTRHSQQPAQASQQSEGHKP